MNFIRENVWTWAGTALALITLSGVVQKQAFAIAGVAMLVQLLITMLMGDSE